MSEKGIDKTKNDSKNDLTQENDRLGENQIMEIIKKSVVNAVPLSKDQIKVTISLNNFLNTIASFSGGSVKVISSKYENDKLVIYTENNDNNNMGILSQYVSNVIAKIEMTRKLVDDLGSMLGNLDNIYNQNNDVLVVITISLNNKVNVPVENKSKSNNIDF